MRALLRPEDFEHSQIRVGDLNMHMVSEGPRGGSPVILLHGFPEFWYSWRYQIKALAGAGFRAIAPDQRGYNLTDKNGPYDCRTLATDIANLLGALGYERAVIIGHDWGGIVAWAFAMLYPAMTETLIVCNAPHPSALAHAFRSLYWTQIRKSWYMAAFQIPALPEMGLRRNNYAWLVKSVCAGTNNILSDDEISYFRESWSQPGALSAAVGYYRAMPGYSRSFKDVNPRLRMPVRMIWGDPDKYLDSKLIEWSGKFCSDFDALRIHPSTHFVQQESPDQVNKHLLEILK